MPSSGPGMISSWEARLVTEFESLARGNEAQVTKASILIVMKQVVRVELFIIIARILLRLIYTMLRTVKILIFTHVACTLLR